MPYARFERAGFLDSAQDMGHAILSFMFNIAVLAMSINVISGVI